MALTYQTRNLNNISKLADHTKAAALKWHDFLEDYNIDILIYETIRTEEEQRRNVENGVSQTMRSYHLVGQALDFVPIENGKAMWDGYEKPDIQKAIAEAKRLGFEWGGDWKDFVDKPHLQYIHKGYGTDTFGQYNPGDPNKVMWKGMELKKGQVGMVTVLKPINLWSRDANDNLQFVKILYPGEEYRVYGYSHLYGGQYDLGGNRWVTKMDGYIKYETPSKAKLDQVNGK